MGRKRNTAAGKSLPEAPEDSFEVEFVVLPSKRSKLKIKSVPVDIALERPPSKKRRREPSVSEAECPEDPSATSIPESYENPPSWDDDSNESPDDHDDHGDHPGGDFEEPVFHEGIREPHTGKTSQGQVS